MAPTNSGTVIIPVDVFKENNWLALSYRPDALLNYVPGPFLPTIDIDLFHRDNKTFEAMTWMSENVYKPFGAFILQMKRTQHQAAMLVSAASFLYSEVDRGEFPNKSIFPFYSLLMMSHIPTEIIYDETITKYGLEQYDILFLHQTETLTRSVYEKIKAFEKRGGIVVADNYLRADLHVDYKIDFNLEHRKKQLADLILQGKGVTADEDKMLMTKYSNVLRDNLDSKVKKYINLKFSEVIFNVLENGPVKYIFMDNDKRTYNDRFGKWKTMHTKGVEQVVEASLNYEGKEAPILYDVRTHAIVPTKKEGGVYKFTKKLNPADGTIIAVYPSAISKINIDLPDNINKGKKATINISVFDSKGNTYGTQPLYIKVTALGDYNTVYTNYYATNNGKFRLNIFRALNDLKGTWGIEITDLTSGIRAFKNFIVK